MNNKLVIAFLGGAVVLSTSACSMTTLTQDEFRLSGTPDGLRAFSDTLTGIQVMAKTEPESLPQNPHSALRVAQEEQKTLRIRLMSGSKKEVK